MYRAFMHTRVQTCGSATQGQLQGRGEHSHPAGYDWEDRHDNRQQAEEVGEVGAGHL
jgi:hypothetical protein